ncbi:MAG: hypothetical protein KDD37_07300 [Bdellovibrionales bacterium]|nr:hypothetical protein [Bdellovibrionales bacterium]
MIVRKFFVVLGLIILNACGGGSGGGSGEGGGHETPPITEPLAEVCVFDGISTVQTAKFLNELNMAWSTYANAKGCASEADSYIAFSAEFTVSIAKLQHAKVIEKSLANRSIEKAIFEIFDYPNCQVKDLNKEEVNNLKNCKWRE